jgi:4-amino-4-deoxy-L-arabinose transferase-like glycosyltransferase
VAVAVLLLTFWLRLTNLEALGLGSLNYAATVQSMLMSGYNFFFLAAEPGGSITIDKPPLALWIQGLSAAVFGFRALALFYPQIVSGLLSTALLYRLVGSKFGRSTGLLAALILATTPINVAVERTNQVDAVLILLLLLAAGAFLRAARIGSRRWLLAGGMLVGLAFNTKMLQALIPLPALLTMYALQPMRGWRHKSKALIGCVAVMAAVGLSWIAAVDLTPPDQRPHVGGSPTNSALNLALGYNGATRLFGNAIPHPPTAWIAGQGFIEPPRSGVELLAAPNPETGLPGPLRLFTGPLNNDIGWLLPLGVLGLVMLIDLARRTRSADSLGQLALWGGWLVVGGTVFSAAGFIHTHYVATLSPAFAALAAIALRQLWRLYLPGLMQLAALAGITSGLVIWQIAIARQYVWAHPGSAWRLLLAWA